MTWLLLAQHTDRITRIGWEAIPNSGPPTFLSRRYQLQRVRPSDGRVEAFDLTGEEFRALLAVTDELREKDTSPEPQGP